MSPHLSLLVILQLLSFWHRSMCVWAAPHTRLSLLLKDTATSEIVLFISINLLLLVLGSSKAVVIDFAGFPFCYDEAKILFRIMYH